MRHKFSHRISNIEEMIFRKLDSIRKEFPGIIDLSRGLPMGMPPREILSEVSLRMKCAENHVYTDWRGLQQFREEIAYFYKDRFNVDLCPDTEIQVLIGSKEGLSALMLACVDQGDEVLVPDPSFPAFRNSVLLADGIPKPYPLLWDNEYRPDIKGIEKTLSGKEKVMIINYPHSPTGAVCSADDFKMYADFAERHGIMLCYDGVYREISFTPHSTLLQVEGAKEHSVEITSLSKTFDMCGWRIGYMVGSADIIARVRKIKSVLDVGQFVPTQYAGMMGLKMASYIENVAAMYKKRAEKGFAMLKEKGYEVFRPGGAFFLWSKVPSGFKTASDFITHVYKKNNVLLMPGSGFGKYGEGFFRISLTPPEKVVESGINALGDMGRYL